MDGLPFTLSPSFEIFSDEPAEKFARFVTTKSRQVKPLILLLEGGKPERDLMLLTCFKVMAEDERQELGETQFMIRIVHSNYYSDTKWQLFAEHFNLSQTESKLCRALADGLTLQEYAELKDVSINTARTQLNTIFTKTSTAKQTSLLRLIFLFARA
jgi:DNA-binding CsgD family transcriptional regulator